MTSWQRLSVHPNDPGTSQMKHPTTSWWNVAKTCQYEVSIKLLTNVVTRSQECVRTTLRLHNVSNETPNDISVVCHQDVSVVGLHGVIKERSDNVSRVHNNDVPLVNVLMSLRLLRLVSNETSNDVSAVRLHNVAQERCSDISKVPNHNASSKSQMKHPVKSPCSTTRLNYVESQRRFQVTLP